jgi:two-component system, OmpR family, sensor kinase
MLARMRRRIFAMLAVAITVSVCAASFVSDTIQRIHGHDGRHTLVALVVVAFVLWTIAGVVAWRMTRPITELVRVVEDIGRGHLASRMKLRWNEHGEVGAIANAVNHMAERIEQQIEDQRHLLATVSHEIRSPIARLRFVLETLRDGDSGREKILDDADREVAEVDALVGDLLASSRVDFDAIQRVQIEPVDLATRALERAGLDVSLCVVEGKIAAFPGDATLVLTALSNLLNNAKKHGGTVQALRIDATPSHVRFLVEDNGKGFTPEEISHVFEAFYRGSDAKREARAGVGLGLALVRRIAEAHGGSAWAENLSIGAQVGVAFARSGKTV